MRDTRVGRWVAHLAAAGALGLGVLAVSGVAVTVSTELPLGGSVTEQVTAFESTSQVMTHQDDYDWS